MSRPVLVAAAVALLLASGIAAAVGLKGGSAGDASAGAQAAGGGAADGVGVGGQAASSGRSATARSATAYCEAFYSRAASIHKESSTVAAEAQTDPIGGLALSLSSIGDLSTMFAAMDAVAPPDIEPDTAAVRQNIETIDSSLGSAATDPVGALSSGLISSLTSAGAFNRVSAYLHTHCPLSSALARRYIGNVQPPPTSATPSPTSGGVAPELIVCDQGSFYAVDEESSATVSSVLAPGPQGQFEQASNAGGCGTNDPVSPSPGFTKWAETSQTADGSTVAGYVAAGSSTFNDESGHVSSYSGATVSDEDPMFSPTGALWWEVAPNGDTVNYQPSTLVDVAQVGGVPVTWGKGDLAGFLPDGDPTPLPVVVSPSGHEAAVLADGDDGDTADLYIGPTTSLSGVCMEKADRQDHGTVVDDDDVLVHDCPGLARASRGPDCVFVGFIDDSDVACLAGGEDDDDEDSTPSFFEVVPFTIAGTAVRYGAPTRLTPPTMLTTHYIGVSPDGGLLWYVVDQDDGTPDLYEVGTSDYTAAPTSYAPMIDAGGQDEDIADVSVEGWLWRGKYTATIP